MMMPQRIKTALIVKEYELKHPEIIKGLKVFYPKLTKGSYIMVHDYNTRYKGAGA